MDDVKEVRVRQFNPAKDAKKVEELERLCEAGPSGDVSLFADLMGDPQCRVRHFPVYTMLVAEIGDEIVGMMRAGIKDMVCGKKVCRVSGKESPVYARAGYLLGLRVSPLHRRKGIALELARATEKWCKEQGAVYAYMATEKDNTASVKLFTEKLGFKPVRTPRLLVHPVFQHAEPVPNHVRLTKLSPEDASALYRSFLGGVDFFPRDLEEAVLASKLYEGTWVATLREDEQQLAGAMTMSAVRGDMRKLMEGSFSSWAVLSVWKCNEIFRLQVAGVSWRKRAMAAASRWLDMALPWLRISSFPNVFQPFGMQFMFGIHAQGKRGGELLGYLCRHARNVARESRCQVVMAELGSSDPLVAAVPHWRSMSSADDLWCVKDLLLGVHPDKIRVGFEEEEELLLLEEEQDWMNAPVGSAVFVDPRDV